jgi:hypothetical protein
MQIKFQETLTLLVEVKLSLFTILIDHKEEKGNKLATVVEIGLFLSFLVSSKRLTIVRLKFSNSLQSQPICETLLRELQLVMNNQFII